MKQFIPESVLAVTPHGDDVTLFAGGTLGLWASRGTRIMVVRVTQDEKDSLEGPVDETIAVNKVEFEDAMKTLGVSETCHLGFRDCELMDVPYGNLRERLIRKIREFRPQVIMGFDPAATDDENPDHPVVAKATADASWAAGFPNFHPEHAEAGLKPWVPLGNMYFTRHFVVGDDAVDIAESIETKIRAVICHRNMMCTQMKDQRRRIEAAGFHPPFICERADDDYATYWEAVVGAAATMAGQGTGFEFAERFRSTFITDSDELVQLLSSLC